MDRTRDSGSRDRGSTPRGRIKNEYYAPVAELADAQRSGRCLVFQVQVRLLSGAFKYHYYNGSRKKVLNQKIAGERLLNFQ